jgi:hypothetical protein
LDERTSITFFALTLWKKSIYKSKGGKFFHHSEFYLHQAYMPNVLSALAELSHHQVSFHSAIGRALLPSDEFSTLLPTK